MRRGGSVSFWIVTAILGLFYAYAVVAAVGNWVGISLFADTLAGGLSVTGVFWLGVGVLLPIVLFAITLIIGWNQSFGVRVLLLVLGLSLTSIVQLLIMHYVPTTSYFLLN